MAKKDFSDVTGLPDDLGIGDDLARAEQHLTVRVESRRYGKPMTIVEGFEDDSVDLRELASTLKRRLATGGTVDGGHIELQGDHAARLPDVLREEGFQVD
ncbi:stress response translation initiation inhibitor YciH [Halomarina litorea]|uniref:stress response translation initiation inhibitor YciH n=1 Tax=Halomarina litorea TaxID=2961595 RepID=UPI0020C1FD4D|nr:stress response translation initiation inhibitor YciH [Halomarina sp. BCD28]